MGQLGWFGGQPGSSSGLGDVPGSGFARRSGSSGIVSGLVLGFLGTVGGGFTGAATIERSVAATVRALKVR